MVSQQATVDNNFNKLTEYFSRPEGMFHSVSSVSNFIQLSSVAATSELWLNLDAYATLLLPDPKAVKARWQNTTVYRLQNTNVWSIIPVYHPKSVPHVPVYPPWPGTQCVFSGKKIGRADLFLNS
jgi:hypothetical protein